MMLATHSVPVLLPSRAIGRRPLHGHQGIMLGGTAARVGCAGTRVDQHTSPQGGARLQVPHLLP